MGEDNRIIQCYFQDIKGFELKFLKVLFVIFVVIFVKLFALVFKGTRKTVDVGVDAYQSVKNSDSFNEAYQNFANNKYAKARLSVPEEIIALMAKIAASDGKISALEVEFMSDTIKSMAHAMKVAGVHPTLIKQMKQKLFALANRAKKDENPVSYYCHSLANSAQEVRLGAMMQIISFASLDGLSEKTTKVLFEIGEHLKFTQSEIEGLFAQLNGSGASANLQADPYEILGVESTDDFALIKKRYRKLVKANHPDFMHGQGMQDSEIQAATEKMQEINAAYEIIKQQRGV